MCHFVALEAQVVLYTLTVVSKFSSPCKSRKVATTTRRTEITTIMIPMMPDLKTLEESPMLLSVLTGSSGTNAGSLGLLFDRSDFVEEEGAEFPLATAEITSVSAILVLLV